MHPEAMAFVEAHQSDDPVAVLDIGGRNINGTPRHLFPNAHPYTVLDIAPGDGVDIVADASMWIPGCQYDVVVCCEVFEHTPVWPEILTTAWLALVPGGKLILTMAGPGRPVHSAVDGAPYLHEGEHYANVEPLELHRALDATGFRELAVDVLGFDVRAIAYR